MENILELSVKIELSQHFVNLVKNDGGTIKHVVEITKGVLHYIIEADKSIHNKLTDYGFHTFIKNPVFQKYYHGTSEFKEIADKYISDRNNRDLLKVFPSDAEIKTIAESKTIDCIQNKKYIGEVELLRIGYEVGMQGMLTLLKQKLSQ